MQRLKRLARVIVDGRPWLKGHAPYLLRQVYDRGHNGRRELTDRDHLLAAARWLATAQDVTGDGGVCGRYFLHRGWSSSYPETTGYILPTFLALADELGDEGYRERARQCLEFLLPLQLENGAFPGLEIAQNRTEPSPFNTAQIINGLIAWHRHSGEERAIEAARRAGDWLMSVQDDDGAFRKHYYFNTPSSYSTHASCWLAELGQHTSDRRYLDSARRHLDWALALRDAETGWFDLCGFDAEDHKHRRAVTHTIAYTLWGVLFTSHVLGREDGIAAVREAAERIARRVELSGRLPGVLDHRWRPAADYVCLTGNAQMALIWMRLHALEPNLRFVNAAFKAIDGIKAAQSLDNPNPALRGGIAGSDPVWGAYIRNALPNWPAKFFIDALLEKQHTLARLRDEPPAGNRHVPADVSTALPDGEGSPPPAGPRTVLYTSPRSKKPAQMLRAWGDKGVKVDAIVVEQDAPQPALDRLIGRIREEGLAPIVARLRPGGGAASRPAESAGPAGGQPALPDPHEAARQAGIAVVNVASLSSPEGVAAVSALRPDVAVHAGAGILRQPLLDVAPLGTLNAHMGLLPHYRGMNVTEWSAFQSDPVGCTVHVVDPGIDTGDILCVRLVEAAGAPSIGALRHAVDTAQIDLLGDVLRYVQRTGALPPRRPQRADEGRTYFRMHEDLRALLEELLRDGRLPRG